MREGASGCVTVRPYPDEEVRKVTTARDPLPKLPERLRLFCHLFAAAMVLTWILNALPYPARFGAIATTGAGVIFAALALWSTAGMEKAFLIRGVLVVGGVISMLTALSATVMLIVADELVELSRCEQRALTSLALEQCQDEFATAFEDKLGVSLPNQ